MIDDILGSKTKVRILRLLVSQPNREFSQQDVASVLRLSTGSVAPALRQLLAVRAVLSRRVGRSRAFGVNRGHPLFPSLRAVFRAEAASLVSVARAFARSLPNRGIEAAVLFGSAARGAPSPRSDVDVLVVVDSPRGAETIRKIAGSLLDRFDVNLSPLVLTSDEVRRRLHAYDPLLLTIAAEGKMLRGEARWLGR